MTCVRSGIHIQDLGAYASSLSTQRRNDPQDKVSEWRLFFSLRRLTMASLFPIGLLQLNHLFSLLGKKYLIWDRTEKSATWHRLIISEFGISVGKYYSRQVIFGNLQISCQIVWLTAVVKFRKFLDHPSHACYVQESFSPTL